MSQSILRGGSYGSGSFMYEYEYKYEYEFVSSFNISGMSVPKLSSMGSRLSSQSKPVKVLGYGINLI